MARSTPSRVTLHTTAARPPAIQEPAVAAPILRLHGWVQPYAWGSRAELARLQGRATPTAEPEAELWFGAHPRGPAVAEGIDGRRRPLHDVVADDPVGQLGADVAARFGPTLPYLLKVLAVEHPLSLQVHPSEPQARAGFDDEEARGIPRDAPERTFRDPWPKPELLCALTPFTALVGFRDPSRTVQLLRALDVSALAGVAERLEHGDDAAFGEVVRDLLTWPSADRATLVAAVSDAASTLLDGGPFADEARHLVSLAAAYPCDPGVVVASLLELVRLAPGEVVYLPPGQLHSYLHGTAVELMAVSDNVLRGGLTAKHIDVDGVLALLDSRALTTPLVASRDVGTEVVYDTGAPHFRLSRVQVDGEVVLDRRGPETLLVVEGDATASADGTDVPLAAGQAAFVPASARTLHLDGKASVFRAGVGDLEPASW